MKLIKRIFKFIAKEKGSLALILLISLFFLALSLWGILTSYYPSSRFEKHEVRLHSPAVHLERSDHIFGRGRSIKIVSGDYEFSYGSYKSAKTEEYLAHERLQLEEYLDIIYIIRDDTYIIVEIHGVDYTYYTIDDYDAEQKGNLVGGIAIYLILQIPFLVLCVALYINSYVKPFPVSKRLRKKHPVEKHVYYDEENEFSPYKQKLIEQEREEE